MNEKIMLAAIVITMQLPVSAAHAKTVAKTYGVDYKAVMAEVNEMLSVESVAVNDMRANNK